MKYKVVLVSFPFDDLSDNKVRPAVCLTGAVGQHRHVVLAFITSRVPKELLETDVLIKMDDDDFENTGLRVTSTLRLHRMMTVTTDIIRRELGQLSDKQQEIVQEKIKALFGLD